MTLKRIVLGERRQTKREYILYDSIYVEFSEMHTGVQREREGADQWFLGSRRNLKKGYEESFEGDRYVHYLDCVGFTSIYTSTIFKLYALTMSVYYMSVSPQ